ncbi:MAG: SBBP repeat-containing protein, partial [Terriglobia bacterium]
ALTYSTYLGGTGADVGQSIKVDSSGNAYVAGYTFSTDFPTVNPIQNANLGRVDAFVAEVNSAGSALIFSTYLGGSGDDKAYGIALDSSKNIYVTGMTQSTDFVPDSTSYHSLNNGQGDVFVCKLGPAGAGVIYSALLGGSGVDQGNAIAVDSSGDAFVTGTTQSSDFSTANPLQVILGISGGGSCGAGTCSDAFVTELNPNGSSLIYSTYLGGANAEFGQGIALDTSGLAYVTGSTSSANFPVIVGAYQGALAGVAGNAFIAKIDPSNNVPGMSIVPSKVNFGNQTLGVRSSAQTVTVINPGTSPLSITDITSSSADFTQTNNCIGTVAPGSGTCTLNLTFTPSTLGAETAQVTFTDDAANNPHVLTVTGSGVNAATSVTVAPTNLSFGNQTVGAFSSSQDVTITNTGTAVLNITGISVSGDFKIQTNTCEATLNVLNVGASCVVSIYFGPTASGARSGTLSIADNATGSPQNVALAGTGVAIFTVSATSTTTTVVIGSTTATFTINASAPSSFTGNISFTCSAGLTCAFSTSPIFAGQTTTLTLSSLTTTMANPLNFYVYGTSGSQTASVALTLLFSDYALSATPGLNTIASGSPANYTIVVTPSFGLNQRVDLSCSNLPIGATCTFDNASVTPNGSPVNAALTINTIKNVASLPPQRWPLGGAPPPWALGIAMLGLLGSLLLLRRRTRPDATSASWNPMRARLVALAVSLLVLALLLGACRPANTTTGGTLTGNYTITITGTLHSNTAVTRTTTLNLSVT